MAIPQHFSYQLFRTVLIAMVITAMDKIKSKLIS